MKYSFIKHDYRNIIIRKIREVTSNIKFNLPTDNNNPPSQYITQVLTPWWKVYEDFIGITEVKEAQARVIQVSNINKGDEVIFSIFFIYSVVNKLG